MSKPISPSKVSADMAAKIAELESTTSAADALLEQQVADQQKLAEQIEADRIAAIPPVFKSWRIEKLEDLYKVDADQAEKVFYFLQHCIRKARMEKKILKYFVFSEQGGGRILEMKTKDQKIVEDEEVDPLS